LTDVSAVRTPTNNSALMMGAVRTSETSVNFNVITRCYIPEDTELNKSGIFVQKHITRN
jgi:hypothetical protein